MMLPHTRDDKNTVDTVKWNRENSSGCN